MNSILITGAAGFIGGTLADYFKRRGLQVFVDAQPENAGATRRWPLTYSALMQATGGAAPDAIVHAAGSGTVGKVAADPAQELPANLAAFLAVLEFARVHAPRARIVLLSSAALYGEAPAEPQFENATRPPISLYGLAKLQAEQLAQFYNSHAGLATTSVRMFSVYGPGLRKQLLWDAMRKFATGRSDFFGTGEEVRDWVHVDDVCRFIDCLLESASPPGFEAFNCGGSRATTSDVLSHLAAVAGAVSPRFNGQARAGDPQCLVADCSKARMQLGWSPTMEWRDGIAAYANWFKAQAGDALPSGDRDAARALS